MSPAAKPWSMTKRSATGIASIETDAVNSASRAATRVRLYGVMNGHSARSGRNDFALGRSLSSGVFTNRGAQDGCRQRHGALD
jgi:hypothetical protein